MLGLEVLERDGDLSVTDSVDRLPYILSVCRMSGP
jgi:hypothetical protein